jgi:hypothetical protein
MAYVRKSSSAPYNKAEDVLTYFASVCIALGMLPDELGYDDRLFVIDNCSDMWVPRFAGIEKPGWSNKVTVDYDRDYNSGDYSGEGSLYIANLGGNRVRMELRDETVSTFLHRIVFWLTPHPC